MGTSFTMRRRPCRLRSVLGSSIGAGFATLLFLAFSSTYSKQ